MASSYTTDTFYADVKNRLVDMSASVNIEELLCQGWIMEDDRYTLDYATEGGKIDLSIRSFHFFNDHTFIRNIFTRLETGQWQYNDADKKITLTYNDGGGGDHFKIRAIAHNILKLTDTDVGRGDIFTYVADGLRYKNKMADPFYIANQQWQVKPAYKESTVQLKNRLKAYLHFFELFYEDKIARQAVAVSFYGFPTCINWHGSGMSMKDESDLSNRWKNCFYNEAQAKEAYAVIEKLMQKKYTFPKENINWIKKNLYLLQQVIANFDKLD